MAILQRKLDALKANIHSLTREAQWVENVIIGYKPILDYLQNHATTNFAITAKQLYAIFEETYAILEIVYVLNSIHRWFPHTTKRLTQKTIFSTFLVKIFIKEDNTFLHFYLFNR